MLGTPKSLVNGVAQWSNWPISSSVSGRMPWRSTARPRTLRCGVAISTWSPSAMPSFAARLRVDDHAAMARDVVGDLLDQLHADVGAPRVLHAARGQQPERIVLRLAAGLLERRRSTARRNPCTSAAPGTRPAACPTSACRARAAAGRARCRCAAAAPDTAARSAGPCRRASGTDTSWCAGTAWSRGRAPSTSRGRSTRGRRSARRSRRGTRRPRSPRARCATSGASEKSQCAPLSGTPAAPLLIDALYFSRRPVRRASSVAIAVKSRASPCVATAGWRSAKPCAPRTARRTSSRRCGSAAGFRGRSPRAAGCRRNDWSRRACTRRRPRTGSAPSCRRPRSVSQNEIAGLVR